MMFADTIITFDKAMPKSERIGMIALVINALIEEHENRTMKDGVQTFQEKPMERVRGAHLSELEWLDSDCIAVHPHTCENAKLVAIDAHQLLLRISMDGWAWSNCNTMPAQIPRGQNGQEWIEENLKLVRTSNGLLPPYNVYKLRVATARGSHTTASVRIMRAEGRCIFDALGIDGKISISKIVERQPSMLEPVKKGLRVEVVDDDLCLACPRRMEILPRTGNAGNNVYREQTVLQNCVRVLTLLQDAEATWPVNEAAEAKIIDQACVGNGDKFEDKARDLVQYARACAGQDGSVLTRLALFERVQEQKVKSHAHDLNAIAGIDNLNIDLFLEAMVKAMLCSPPSYVDALGYSTLFGTQD